MLYSVHLNCAALRRWAVKNFALTLTFTLAISLLRLALLCISRNLLSNENVASKVVIVASRARSTTLLKRSMCRGTKF